MKINCMTRLQAAWLLIFSGSSLAALSVDQTRYIFESNRESVSIVVENAAKQTYGGQMWVENREGTDTRPAFIVTPSFFKVSGESKQVLRVVNVLKTMPEDKESVFWVNLQEIPPVNKEGGLSIALRTKVKLFYRPADLMRGREVAEEDLSLVKTRDKTELVNTTPYVFTILKLLDPQDRAVILDKQTQNKLRVFAPGDSVILSAGSTVKSVMSINDNGQLEQHIIDDLSSGSVTSKTSTDGRLIDGTSLRSVQ